MTVLLVFMCLLSQVLALAAQELSKPGTQKEAPPPAVCASTDSSPRGGHDRPVDWRQEVERRIQSKTRRLTKVVTAFRNMRLFIFALWSFHQLTVNFSPCCRVSQKLYPRPRRTATPAWLDTSSFLCSGITISESFQCAFQR